MTKKEHANTDFKKVSQFNLSTTKGSSFHDHEWSAGKCQDLSRGFLPALLDPRGQQAALGVMYPKMKRSRLTIILLIVVIPAGCGLWIWHSKTAHEQPGTVSAAGLKRLKALPLTQVRGQGATTIARLQNPMQIDGFPCDAGWIHFTESGQLRAFTLAETCTIQGNQLPKRTWIRLDPDMAIKFCSFPENANIQGYICRGGMGGSEGVTTSFYPSGRLSGFYPPNDIEIQGIPCKASSFSPINLYENGYLKEFTLSRDAEIGGRALSEGQKVVLDEQGSIQSVSNPSLFQRARNLAHRLFR